MFNVGNRAYSQKQQKIIGQIRTMKIWAVSEKTGNVIEISFDKKRDVIRLPPLKIDYYYEIETRQE